MQIIQYQFMPGFVAAMSEDGIVHDFRIQPAGGQYAVGHDEAVHQDQHLQFGSLQHGTDGHDHFQSTEIAQDVACRTIAVVVFHAFFQYLIFVSDTCTVQPAAGTDAFFQGDAGEVGHPHGGRRSVADTHFAETQDIASFLVTASYDFGSAFQTKFHFGFRHGCFMEVVGSAAAYFHIDDALFVGQVIIHSRIDQLQLEPVLAAEEVYSGSSMQEVAQLLPGHFFGRQTDTFLYNAVVGGKDDVLRFL